MTSTLSPPPIEINSEPLPTSSELANGIHNPRSLTPEGDDRSSSLSEIGDRVGNDDLTSTHLEPTEISEVNDTEAETERLDDSPQKTRRNKNVVLESSTHILSNGTSPLTIRDLPISDSNMGFDGERLDQLSEMSSLADSGEEISKATTSLSPSSRKRKRPTPEKDSLIGGHRETKPRVEHPTQPEREPVNQPITVDVEHPVPYTLDEMRKSRSGSKILPAHDGDARTTGHTSLAKQKSKKGKRKSKKVKDEGPTALAVVNLDIGAQIGHAGAAETEYSNGDDAEIDDAGEDGEIDLNARNEEGLFKKKSAMDSLSAIEKCFASLRDRLFKDKLAQYNEELVMLDQPNPTHPEFLAMMRVIDRRRDEKIEYEQTLLKYKLMTLQRTSTAEKAQVHAQYMQTTRDIRERSLEKLNEESYQLQKERRNVEGEVPDYTYNFPTKRSQQIANQTAYNAEVSILSGVAKHVGFPAAPELSALKASEIEDDLQSMGITAPPASRTKNQQPLVRTSLAAAGFSWQKPAAEEQFLEQNPWANPQHPAHQNHHILRQNSGISRPDTPSSAPIAQRRVIELTRPYSRPTSSTPTPNPGERARRLGDDLPNLTVKDSVAVMLGKGQRASTNGTVAAPSVQEAVPIGKAKGNGLGVFFRSRPSSASRSRSQKSRLIPDVPAKLSLNADPSALTSTVSVPPSTPVRYSIIKAEESLLASRPSPPLQYHHPSVPNRGPLTGQVDRIGA